MCNDNNFPGTNRDNDAATDSLDSKTQVKILLAEYDNLRTEIRMYVEQISPKMIFLITGIAGIATVASNLKDFDVPVQRLIYIGAPALIFLVSYLQIAQGYIISAIAGRIRSIEKKIKELNGGKAIMKWEHKIAPYVICKPIVKFCLPESGKKITIVNPIFIFLISVALFLVALLCYSIYNIHGIFATPWDKIYLVTIGLFIFLGIIQTSRLFKIPEAIDAVDGD